MGKSLGRFGFLTIGIAAGLVLALNFDGERDDSALSTPAAPGAQAQSVPLGEVKREVPKSAANVIHSYAPIVEQVVPTVVNIYTTKRVSGSPTVMDDSFFRFFFGDRGRQFGRERVERSLGSGVIASPNGRIITNNHVVQGADEIIVVLSDRREFPAKLVFKDERTDLAVLEVDAGGEQLPAAKIGNSDELKVGDIVLAIGNPFGVGQTVTHGIVSAVARTGVGISDYQFFIQTDAAVNPGNSGGALVAMTGELIGINTAIFSRSGGSNGIGFAIPVNMVKTILGAADTGQLVRAWIGVEGQGVTADLARALGLKRPVGVLVDGVSPQSPAARAGVAVGDVIFAIDGQEVGDADTLRYRIATKPIGGKTILTLIRKGEVQNVSVPLRPPPEVPPRQLTTLGGNTLFTGVTIGNLSPAFAQELGAGVPERGVIVLEVDPRAPAARTGVLRPGDLVMAVNDVRVETVADVERTLAANPQALAFQVNRAGQPVSCSFRPPSQLRCRR